MLIDEHQRHAFRVQLLRDQLHDEVEEILDGRKGGECRAGGIQGAQTLHGLLESLVLQRLRFMKPSVLQTEEPLGCRSLGDGDDMVQLEGLVDVVVGSLAESLDGGLRGGLAGHHDDLRVRIAFLDTLEEAESVHPRENDVEERDGDRTSLEFVSASSADPAASVS